jgi:hypothetical protein
MRTLLHSTLPCLLALVVLSRGSAAQRGGWELFSAEVGVARAADANRDGTVDSEEWSAFLASLEAGEGGALDGEKVLARMLATRLDTGGGSNDGGDGLLTRADVAARLERLDADGSGSIERGEMLGVQQGFARGGAGAPEILLDGLVAFGCDVNEDRSLDPDEWELAVGDRNAPVGPDVVAAWIARAERYVPDDRQAFGPGTLTLTLRSNLDATQDGRLALDDLAVLFTRLDADSSGSLSPEELARPPQGAGAGARVRPAATPDPSRPPLMPWQRSLEDSLALSRASGKPLLVCVNIDGEAASDELAYGRYRDPAFVELVKGFVPVLASPDRHRPRDRDGANRRLPDPRFGRLVDEEHIAIEPLLYERWFDGRRVAPRHVAVSPEGEVLFDLFLLQDLRAIDEALRAHGKPDAPWTDVATLDEAGLLASRDAAARERLEALWDGADPGQRTRLLLLSLDEHLAAPQPELLRRALRDPSRAVRIAAVASLAQFPLVPPIDVFPEALRVARELGLEPTGLAEALERRTLEGPEGERVRARRLARIFRAAGTASTTLDVELWTALLEGADANPLAPVGEGVFERLTAIEALASRSPGDVRLTAAHARAALDAAERLIAEGGGNPGFLLQDAEDAARRAVEMDPEDVLSWAVLARSTFQLSDFAAAGDAAARALPGLLGWGESARVADALDVLARSRTRQLYEVLGAEPAWPAGWLADLLAAQRVLLAHPLSTEAQAREALDVLGNLELFAEQAEFARAALRRWPLSADLHNYYRWVLLRDGGATAVIAAYTELDLGAGYAAPRAWFAGVAAIVAAERLSEDGDAEGALADYAVAVGELEASIAVEPGYGSTARYYVALAQAGAARLHLESGDLEASLAALRASVTALETGLGADGLGNTRARTARALARAFERAGRPDEAAEASSLAEEEEPEEAG